MGCKKFMWSNEAVTTGLRAWRMAVMAPARSTRFMTLPPSTLPRPLASVGNASSAYSDMYSRTGFPLLESGLESGPESGAVMGGRYLLFRSEGRRVGQE